MMVPDASHISESAQSNFGTAYNFSITTYIVAQFWESVTIALKALRIIALNLAIYICLMLQIQSDSLYNCYLRKISYTSRRQVFECGVIECVKG